MIFFVEEYMIKRIIFDVDNTLLDTYKDCINAYAEFLKDYPNIKPKMFYDVIGEFELKGIGFDKDELSKYISDRLKILFSKEDLNRCLDIYAGYSTLLNDDTSDVLDYLSKKYTLVVLTNWYTDAQKGRLRYHGLDKYFMNIYGCEYGIKPNKEFFDLARENDNYDECVMIGDSLSSDINPAKALGMKTIYISKDNENTDSTINDIRKLKDIL